MLRALGEHDEARRALLRAAALAPDDGEIQEALAVLQWPTRRAPRRAPFAHFSGDLGSFGLPEILEFMRVQQKTGSLVISSRQGAGIVRLVQGRLTSVSAPGVQRLGETLVSRGIISRSDLEAALAIQRADLRQTSEALGSVLLRKATRRPRTAQSSGPSADPRRARRDAELAEGAFSFHPGTPAEIPSISFDTQSVVMEFFRMTDDDTSRSSST